MKHILPVLLLLLLAGVLACGDDDPVVPPPPSDRTFLDLSQNWHVLNNVELAYNRRNITRYDALVGVNFTFFLSAGDVGGGLAESWDRSVELQANAHLFSTTPPEGYPRCTSLKLNLQWETDDTSQNPQPKNLGWTELPNSGPNSDETWYRATVGYDFQIDVDPDITLISNPGSKAEFTVRNAGTSQAPHWLLVEMRDLGSTLLVSQTSTRTQPTTLGKVKALYR